MSRDWKAEAVKQWNFDPCGADRETVFGTPEFFARVEQERYGDYAPWMRSVVGFERYKGKHLLEVGFGLGSDHISFARNGAICFGVDLTPAHVSATQRRLQLERFPVRLTRGDAETLAFASNSFDAAYSFGVLHHTPETAAAINEIHRVLRPGGEAIIGLYHRNSIFYWRNCVLIQGLLRGGFFRDGYRKTLSQIERREHSDAVPLVKVYSRRAARRLFSGFSEVRVDVRHFSWRDLGSLGRAVDRLAPGVDRYLAKRFGWYLIIRATK